ncbi:hypothetical protein EVAR_76006_1 [Eumeta japonica]|uniref:Uncharacterized protein n=1 Tax=Eumeta variegata TaxID=151549 RepID=A0A4C1UA82_EUMVA|nr:hypothetical protein EVAR_76006_1 [Eumeta japonica]
MSGNEGRRSTERFVGSRDDSPSWANTLGRTFSCQAAAVAAASSAASTAQRSTSIALVTGRHHSYHSRTRCKHSTSGRTAAGGETGARWWRRGARTRGRRPAVSHAWGCGVRTSHVTQPSPMPSAPRTTHPPRCPLAPCNVIIVLEKAAATPNERRH